MDAGEITQCAQMYDGEWDVLYVTSIALPLRTNASERLDSSSPQEAVIKLDILVEMSGHDTQT